jgi:hypothetical protein
MVRLSLKYGTATRMIVYGVASVVVFLFLVGPIRGRTLRRLERVAPGSVVFTVSNRRAFAEALSRAAAGSELGLKATGLTSGPCVTADALGLSFWDNTPLQYLGAVDWSRIVRIEVGNLQTVYRRWSSSALLVHVRVGDGIVIVPLLSPNGTRAMSGSRRESTYLAAELESLRNTSVHV